MPRAGTYFWTPESQQVSVSPGAETSRGRAKPAGLRPAPALVPETLRTLQNPLALSSELKRGMVPGGADMGFTGDICEECGSAMMTRNGSCLKCMSCGSTTGCS